MVSSNVTLTTTVANSSHEHVFTNIADRHFKICGNNLLKSAKIVNRGCITFTYDSINHTYTCVAPIGSSTWGYGITFSNSYGQPLIIPSGETIYFSLEIYVDQEVECKWDVNNQFYSGTASSSNDNDSSRTSSSSTAQAGKWTKMYWSYTAPTDRDLCDANSNFGVITTDLTSSVSFKLRNISASLGTILTYYTPPTWMEGDSITGAVWNDYAEYRKSDCQEFGRVLVENGDDTLSISTERLQPFAGVSSDTWGFCQGETEKAKTPIAVAGRVLVYPYRDRNEYKPGDVVCAAPNGTVDIMTPQEEMMYPSRIVGTVSCVPDYEEWGSGDREPAKVNGRIWIKVK